MVALPVGACGDDGGTTIVAYRMDEVPVTAGAWTVYVRASDGVLADTTPIGP